MTAIWFCSDLHIHHGMVAGLRGFADVDDHDAAVAANWDRLVRPGIKHLVSGNHDETHPMRSRAHKRMRRWLDVFETVQSVATLRIAGQRVLLSHFPYRDDPDGDHAPESRHAEWRMPDTGQWLLHGHTHSHIQVRGRQIHVGLDAHQLRPVPLPWVADTISKGHTHVRS
ncbi:hypothetical protein [Nocardia farcinica]|uniref:hypothetical protein n=1 Tax=Nocardia farcinica TaxID=37329 RepID=UPI00245485C5|nr:hypothetical protein [Nocardia farcinica]